MIKITATIILMLVTLMANAQTEKTTTTDYGIMRDCFGGFGQCSAPNDTINKSQTGRRFSKINNNSFILEIDRVNITEDEELYLAGKKLSMLDENERPVFSQHEDIILSDETLRQFGVDSKYKLLKKGSYPTIITEEKVIITITLVENK